MNQIKPGCVQHDCEKCQAEDKLLEFLIERMRTIVEFATSDKFSTTYKLGIVESIVGACARRIKQHQQTK